MDIETKPKKTRNKKEKEIKEEKPKKEIKQKKFKYKFVPLTRDELLEKTTCIIYWD